MAPVYKIFYWPVRNERVDFSKAFPTDETFSDNEIAQARKEELEKGSVDRKYMIRVEEPVGKPKVNANSTVGQLLADANMDIRERIATILSKCEGLLDLGLPSVSLEATIPDLVKMTRACRLILPSRSSPKNVDGSFARLDEVLIPLYLLQRMIDTIGPLDQPSGYVSPDSYDVFMSDIKPHDLPTKISEAMGVKYLSPVESKVPWPLTGKVWGINRRILFTLPVAKKNGNAVNVHFIFDTGSPATYIAKSTLDALGVQEWQLGDAVMTVNGTKTLLTVSDSVKTPDGKPCHFVGLNLLGMDYLDRINGKLLVEMQMNTATILVDG